MKYLHAHQKTISIAGRVLFPKSTANTSLQKTILLITLVFTILIGGILSVLSSYYYATYSRETVIRQTASNLSYMVDSIDSNLKNLNHFIFFCQNHNYILKFMDYTSSSKPATAVHTYDRLNEELLSSPANSFIHRLIIGNEHGRYLQIVETSYSTSQNVDEITRRLDFFDIQLSAGDLDLTGGFIDDPYTKGFIQPVLILIRPISTKSASVIDGYISLSLNPSLFTSPMKYYSMSADSALYLTLGEHTYLMNRDESLTEILSPVSYNPLHSLELSQEGTAYSYIDSQTGKKSFCITKPLSYPDCYITQVVSETELRAYHPFYVLIPFVITFIILIVGLLLSAILYHVISVPVTSLKHRLSEIASGNFERDTSIEWNHELGEIGREINNLSESMDALINARLKDEKDKKDLEYQMLQSQINPHFLYNTLNSIKWMAATQGAVGIAEVTTALSRLLRNISKGTGNIISLREELSLLQDYFTIQQYRYGGTITLDIRMEEESLYDCSIIKFTLQPIVENAIFHGIEPKQAAGRISLRIFSETESTLCLVVEDNGVGIAPEKIAVILQQETNTGGPIFFKNIGIPNIHKRLQYEYGASYGLQIESCINEYTRVTVRIPKRTFSPNENGGRHVSGIDCR